MLYLDSSKYYYVGVDEDNLHKFKRKGVTVEIIHVEEAKLKTQTRVLHYTSLLRKK